MTMPAVADLGELFALEYLKDFNATQAYLRVKPGVKATSAGVEGHKLLKNPKTQARLKELAQAHLQRLQIDGQQIVDELKLIGFSNVQHYEVDPDGWVLLDLQRR